MNKTISRYLSQNILYPQLISETPSDKLGIIVVIPCYNEPNIIASIESIANCHSPSSKVEIIVSINASVSSHDDIKERNLKSEKELIKLKPKLPDWLSIYPIINNNLSDKKAGVGLGRKIGMDEAVRRFVSIKNERGIIVCFDADSLCDPEYLCKIEAHFENQKIESASIHFEHPIEGYEYSSGIYESIVQYELHLRYFIRIQKLINLPYSYHTIGSSMACTTSAYCAVGGMNQRKAGEDFYFIHKLVKYGKHSELNSTKVIPSPRVSDRVPFGTGRAIGAMQHAGLSTYMTYHPQSFFDLKIMVDSLQQIFENQEFGITLPQSIGMFLDAINGNRELNRIINNTSDYPSFCKMFWHWFDAFILIKYLHFGRDNFYPDIPVLEAVNQMKGNQFSSEREALKYFREVDIIS